MKRASVPAAVLVVWCASGVFAGQGDPEAYRVTRPAERITCLSPGLEAPKITSCVIETGAGLVLVDTGLSPAMAERTLARIRSEVGRNDVRWVLNTHGHFDHSNGNQVFADALILGHENAPAEMQEYFDGRERWIAGRLQRLDRLDAEAAGGSGGPQAMIAAAERRRFNEELIRSLRTDFRPTPPAIRFSDRLGLTAGDLELQLVWMGRCHTTSDILIHVPALKAVFTGDLFDDQTLGPVSGGGPVDVDRWLAALDEVLADGNLAVVIGGHGLVFTPQWIAAQRRYLGEVWEAVGDARAAGEGFAQLAAGLPFDERFADVAKEIGAAPDVLAARHAEVLRELWRVGLRSAAEEIGRTIREGGVAAAAARWPEIRDDAGFYVDERELNSLGYRLLLDERRPEEALAVFEMNTQAFPESWNVWDSYAEAHWWVDDLDGVERNYRRALELNPGAESARRAIGRVEGYRLDRDRETGARLAFAEGGLTGLDGPYLGQRPPGTTPEVFAPGIVSTAEGYEFSITVSPDGREIYFTRRIEPDGRNTIMVSRRTDDGWTAPEPAPFAAGRNANEPHLTPDGRRLYFGGPTPEGRGPGIWVVEREGAGWSEPVFHGHGMFASSTADGDLYMMTMVGGRPGGIAVYPKAGDGWGEPEVLGGGVNRPENGVHGWVAADGSFIVFDSYQRDGAQGGEGDLFVAFRHDDGGWGEARNLGDEINHAGTNFCPSLSPDGRFLFYSGFRDIYWVSTEVIDRLRD